VRPGPPCIEYLSASVFPSKPDCPGIFRILMMMPELISSWHDAFSLFETCADKHASDLSKVSIAASDERLRFLHIRQLFLLSSDTACAYKAQLRLLHDKIHVHVLDTNW